MPCEVPDDVRAQHAALTGEVAVAPLAGRTQIEVRGSDRAALLHNLCTSDVKRLTPGEGCEAFFTNVQGRILAYVNLLCAPHSVVLDTVPGQSEALLAHLDRYIIREDVQLHDRTDEWSELLLAGPRAEGFLSGLTGGSVPGSLLAHCEAVVGGATVFVRRVDWVGPVGFFLSVPAESTNAVRKALVSAGAVECGDEAVEIARIEAGSPAFGRDITDKNFPQEVGRDARAISFTKGCYLGQETVARIDALGHVNRLLVGLRFEGSEVPRPGTELRVGEKTAATVTSSVYSPRLGAPLAMGYVRREQLGDDVVFESPVGAARRVRLPLS